jgi:DNA (cytosine-5)-methyltransferase 1
MSFDFIDLFAGIGGMRIAFEHAGGRCVVTSEINGLAMRTYEANFPSDPWHVAHGDITTLKSDQIPDHDVLVAGFPCQPYSIAGLRKGLEDERGQVILEVIRILRDKKPRAFLLENVKGLLAHDRGRTFDFLSKLLSDEGYHVRASTLNSMVHAGIPQNRERVFLVGFRDEDASREFIFPGQVELTKSVDDFLETGAILGRFIYSERYGCFEKLKAEVTDESTVYQWRRHYVRENKRGVCPTLTANMGSGGHNVPLIVRGGVIRKLTPRECANLQGFPKSFVLPEGISDSALYHQMGNSVTIPLIERISREMARFL